jgi:O-antigen/teichoic acid export membrane protein
MLLANTIANVIVALFIAWRLKFRKLLGKFNKKMMKGMIKYSFPLVPNNISWLIINMSDRLLLTSMVSSAANGIYAIAAKFPNIITVFYSYFSLAWKEQAAKIVKDKDLTKHYNGIYHDTKRVMFSITLLLIAAMPIAFNILVNGQYSEAFMYIPMIMIATYFMDLSRFYGGIFEAYKNTKIMGTTTFAAAIINLIIDLALLKFIGIWAACISTLVADFTIYLYRKHKIKEYVKLRELNMIPAYIILAIIMGAYYLKFIPNFNMVVYYIINVLTLIFAIVYVIAINKKLIDEILKKIKSKLSRKAKTENKEQESK